MPVLNSVLYLYCTVQFRWTLAIHLHSAIVTCTPLCHRLSHMWAVELLLSMTQKSSYLLYAHRLAMRRLPHYPLYDQSVSVRRLPCTCWTPVLYSAVSFLETSTLFQMLSVSFCQRHKKVLMVCPFNSKALACGGCDVRGFADCLTTRRCCTSLQYVSKTNLIFQTLGGSCLYNFNKIYVIFCYTVRTVLLQHKHTQTCNDSVLYL
jgi:hypothetical protein